MKETKHLCCKYFCTSLAFIFYGILLFGCFKYIKNIHLLEIFSCFLHFMTQKLGLIQDFSGEPHALSHYFGSIWT